MDKKLMFVFIKNKFKEKCHLLFSLKSETEKNKMIELYIIVVIMIYPLYLLSDSFWGIQGRLLLYILVTLITLLLLLLLTIKKLFRNRRYKYKIDILLFGSTLLLAIQTLIKLERSEPIGGDLLFICSIAAYFLVSEADTFYSCYLNRLMLPCVLLFAGLFYHYFITSELFLVELMIQEPQYISSFLLLTVVMGILCYCTEQKAWKRPFFLLFIAIGFFLTLVDAEPIVLLLVPAILLLIPVIFKPTACIVMRSAQLALIYVIFCNVVTLIVNYTQWLKVEVKYNTTYCIYLDIIAAIVSFLFFRYWEKIPEGIPMERIVLIKLRKACIFLLKFHGILFAGILIAASQTAYLPDGPGMVMLKAIALRFGQYCVSNNGTFYQILTEYGLTGFLCIVLLYCLVISRLIKNFDDTKQTIVILTVISIVFLVQSIFIRQQSITTPIYIIFLAFALFSHKMEQI